MLYSMRGRVYKEQPWAKKGDHCAPAQTRGEGGGSQNMGDASKADQIHPGEIYFHLLAALNELPHIWYRLSMPISPKTIYIYICIKHVTKNSIYILAYILYYLYL